MESYPFPTKGQRAQPTYVVDGDTAELFVDRGYHDYTLERYRFLDIDTPELNSKDEGERIKAKEAKIMVQEMMDCYEKSSKVDLKYWPLRIETAKDPDNFGRWLAKIFFLNDGIEISVNAELLREGLAVPYVK